MCFSSSASFVVAAGLLPLGVGAVRYAQDQQRNDLLPLALTPFFSRSSRPLRGWSGLASTPMAPTGWSTPQR
ncbi:hypothetical protein [Cyanobium sp. ATX-6F1]|uniref:hypothetical protein n=1 Tax=Cyanobium sp. ATX-6F1 TaxID=3137388 RepID=UPI0039BE9992